MEATGPRLEATIYKGTTLPHIVVRRRCVLHGTGGWPQDVVRTVGYQQLSLQHLIPCRVHHLSDRQKPQLRQGLEP